MTDDDVPAVRELVERCRDNDRVIGRWTLTDVRAFESEGTVEPASTVIAEVGGGPAAALVLSSAPGRVDGHRRTLPLRLLLAPGDVAPAVLEDLFVAALHALDDRGAWAATAYVDSEEEEVAKAALTASLEHEQSDVCYEIH
jgi:hypothetical protein